jgi:site-specific recombinase XerD
MRERCPVRNPPPPAASCHAVTSWSSTGASAGPWRLRTRAPGPSRPTPTPSGCSPPSARPTASRSSPASSDAEHIQEFIADQLARWKPATAHNRYRGLHAFFKWAVAEGDLTASPMDGMKPPQLSEQPVEVIRLEHLARLLKTCEGRDFTSRRDTAIILLLVDTGMRRAECVGMTLEDVDLDQRIVWVLGKGRRPRALPIGRKTAQSLDRYLRAREGHRLAHLPHLWVGRNGPMTPSGIYQVVHDRARAAGLPAMHPHQLRHAFATSWLAEGGNENELMLVAGWKSRTMIDRYTKATAVERARASHARLSPADRL